MIQIIAVLLAAVTFGTETPDDWARDRAWNGMTEEQRYEASTDMKARAVGLTEEEFIFFSSAVEAESDRGSNNEGRVLIALTIYNRQRASSFPDTISGVLNQSGQFSVVSNGRVRSVGRTNRSDAAILEAHRRLAEGEAPNVMYFNCISFSSWVEPYAYVDGNYFSLG